jgi:hypothetical protein
MANADHASVQHFQHFQLIYICYSLGVYSKVSICQKRPTFQSFYKYAYYETLPGRFSMADNTLLHSKEVFERESEQNRNFSTWPTAVPEIIQ